MGGADPTKEATPVLKPCGVNPAFPRKCRRGRGRGIAGRRWLVRTAAMAALPAQGTGRHFYSNYSIITPASGVAALPAVRRDSWYL